MPDDQKITPFVELGRTGLTRFGGWISEEWLKDLQGQKGVKAYKEMRDNDAIVGAFMFAIEMLIRQVNWRTDTASDSAQDKEAAEFLDSCRGDMSQSWHDTICEILSMLVFGWSYHEIVYKLRQGDTQDPTRRSKYTDGRIGWRKLSIRAQETFFRWEFDESDGGLAGLWQIPPPDYRLRFIPVEKALLFRTRSQKNNPEGRGILRNAWRSYYFKKNIEEIEGIGIERDLAGLPVATVPPELLHPKATPTQKAVLEVVKNVVTKTRRDEMEGVVFPAEVNAAGEPTGYKFSLLSTGARRSFDTNAIITRYDQRIAMTVMADFIMLGHDKVGSFALSSDKTELFGLAMGTILDSICEVFNTYGVPRLFKLNSFQGLTDYPRLAHSDIESPDLAELGAYILSLAKAGAPLFPDDQLENYLRQAAELPEKSEHSEAAPKVQATAQNADGVVKRRDAERQEFVTAVRELRDAVRKAAP